MAEQTIIVAEMDEEGNLTGNAAEAKVSEEATLYQHWTTFGTWDAFNKQYAAEQTELEEEFDEPEEDTPDDFVWDIDAQNRAARFGEEG